jgi:hypothetical protein
MNSLVSASPDCGRRFATTALIALLMVGVASIMTLSRGAQRDTAPPETGMVPVGGIIPFGGPIDDEGAYPGWLPCDGRALTVASHPELYRAIGTAWGGEPNGAAFRLPDLRGRFLRGVDTDDPASARDPEAGLRMASAPGGNTGNRVGTLQEDAAGPHFHLLAGVADGTGPGFNGEFLRFHALKIPDEAAPVVTNGWAVQPTGPGETRPDNVSVHWLIRAR